MCSNHARLLLANENGVEILVVVGEISGGGLRRRRAVTGTVLAEIGDCEFSFTRTVFQEIFQFGRAVHAGDFRQRNLSSIRRRRRDLRGNPRRSAENERSPKDRVADERAHLRCLYIASTVPSRKCKVV